MLHPHPALVPTALAGVGLLLGLAVPAPAQRKSKDAYKPGYWLTDPYTKNDPALLQRAGYVSFGPFPWGDDHGSDAIVKMLPERKVLCVETRHFKLVSTLPAYALHKGATKLERSLLKADLTRLKEILPTVKPGARKLDPWLRLHLFALRLEETYTAVSQQLQVTDADFPAAKGKAVASEPKRDGQQARRGEYMGQGPYLGMRGKFLVLLTEKGGSLNRYAARAKPGFKAVGNNPQPQRHYFTEVGSMFFGTSAECAEGNLYNDHGMRCHLLFNVVHSLVDSYKDFYFPLPVWCREGLAHWHVRRVDPEQHTFTGMKGRTKLKRYDPQWDVKTKKRLQHDDFTPAAKLIRVMDFEELTFGDHMAVWSRIDYLLSLGDAKFAQFMSIMKDRIAVDAGKVPDNAQIWAQQDRAFKTAYGLDAAAFDAGWREFVLKTYPNR
jgi:hypothetical protein